jgi:hypothetical protein
VLSLLASFRDVETILAMTKGGPARLTETLAVRIYNENFEYFDLGASSAMGVVRSPESRLDRSVLSLAPHGFPQIRVQSPGGCDMCC